MRAKILVISASGRNLAASAQRANIDAHVIDYFNDTDTREVAARSIRADGDLDGFAPRALYDAARRLDPKEKLGLVYGSGFEANPAMLSELCRRRPLLGNPPDLVARVKDPVRLSLLLRRLDIPHPEVRSTPPTDGRRWLSKRIGGAGGGHVHWHHSRTALREHGYYQEYLAGETLGVTVLADGRRARVLGLALQWCDDTTAELPFLYAGAVSLPAPPPAVRRQVEEIATKLVEATALRGLCSLDVVVSDRCVSLLEINPRPGATFELHEHAASGLAGHLSALAGNLPAQPFEAATGRAHAIVFAPVELMIPAAFPWPAWVSDRPDPGTLIPAGTPICTVRATERGTAEAKALVFERRAKILDEVRKAAAPEPGRVWLDEMRPVRMT